MWISLRFARKRASVEGIWMRDRRPDPQDWTICSAIWRQGTGRRHMLNPHHYYYYYYFYYYYTAAGAAAVRSTKLLYRQRFCSSSSGSGGSGSRSSSKWPRDSLQFFYLCSFPDSESSASVRFNAGDEMLRRDYSQLGVSFTEKKIGARGLTGHRDCGGHKTGVNRLA